MGRKAWLGLHPLPSSTGAWTDVRGVYVEAGELLISDQRGGIRAPEDGWVAITPAWKRSWPYYEENYTLCNGQSYLASTPADRPVQGNWEILKGASWTATFYCGRTRTEHTEIAFAPVVTRGSDGRVPGAIEDYTGQPSEGLIETWPGQPQTQTELENRLRTFLGDNPLARDFYLYKLEPENYPDPRKPETENPNNHRCDKSPPAYKVVGGSTVPAQEVPFYENAFEATGRPVDYPDAPDPYLRWGKASWKEDFLDNWDGYGWRHIQAKHGWGAGDLADTATVLQNPVGGGPSDDGTGRAVYLGQPYPWDGVVCQRRVVVDYSDIGDPTAPPNIPLGVVTSYAQLVP